MMRSLPRLATLLIVLLTTGPALTAESVETDFDAATDFSAFETYVWHRDVLERDLTDHAVPIDRAIRSTVDEQLARRGLRKVEDAEAADLTVSYIGALYDRLTHPDRDKIKIADGLSLGADPSLVGVARFYKEGVLTIQLLATGDGEDVIWSGISSDTATDRAWYKRGEKMAAKLTRAILKHYPPK